MKSLLSKMFFGMAVVAMSSVISCKEKEASETDMDGTDTTMMVVDPVTPAPATGMPADTAAMSTDTTMVTP